MTARLPTLDGLRGVAVALVVLHHVPAAGAARGLPGGWIGVPLFYALSGYLITTVLLADAADHGRVRLRAFYARRAARLAPALLVVLSVIALAGATGHLPAREETPLASLGQGNWTAPWVAVLTLSTNWWIAADPASLPWPVHHLWSLAVEEQFYLLWAPVLALVLAASGAARRRITRLLPLVVLTAVALTVLTDLTAGPGTAANRVYSATWSYLPALLGGAWLALRAPSRAPRAAGPVALALGVALALFASLGLPHLLVPVLLAQVAALLAVSLALDPGHRRWQQALSWVPLQWLGRRSYGIYLYHFLLAASTAPLGWPWPVRAAVIMVGGVALAELSWRFLEAPVLRIVHERTRPGAPTAD